MGGYENYNEKLLSFGHGQLLVKNQKYCVFSGNQAEKHQGW